MFKSFFKKSETKKNGSKKNGSKKSESKKNGSKKSESKKNSSKKLSNSRRIELYNKIKNKSNLKKENKNKITNINLGENYTEVSEFDTEEITLINDINMLKNHNFPKFKYVGTDGFTSIQFDLKQDEAIQANNGMLNFMDSNIITYTQTNTIWRGLMRKLSGSSFFFNLFTNVSDMNQRLNLSGPFIGNIYAFYIPPYTKFYTIESSYICSTPNVLMSTKFKFGGLMTGYGITYVKAKTEDTPGLVWISSFGPIIPMSIKPSFSIKVDNGILLGFGEDTSMYTRTVRGIKGIFFGGEGLVTEIINETSDDQTIFLQSKSLYSFANYISNINKKYSLISLTSDESTFALAAGSD